MAESGRFVNCVSGFSFLVSRKSGALNQTLGLRKPKATKDLGGTGALAGAKSLARRPCHPLQISVK
jgi:hypothetical protein